MNLYRQSSRERKLVEGADHTKSWVSVLHGQRLWGVFVAARSGADNRTRCSRAIPSPLRARELASLSALRDIPGHEFSFQRFKLYRGHTVDALKSPSKKEPQSKRPISRIVWTNKKDLTSDIQLMIINNHDAYGRTA
jgi:hypothetical protein